MKKRILPSVLVLAIILLMAISLTACASGTCFSCNQSGFFRKTVTIEGTEVTLCNDCYETFSEAGLINSSGSGNSNMPWWGWALIIFFGLGVISVVYKAITKRDLGEDIERLTDKLDEDEE